MVNGVVFEHFIQSEGDVAMSEDQNPFSMSDMVKENCGN